MSFIASRPVPGEANILPRAEPKQIFEIPKQRAKSGFGNDYRSLGIHEYLEGELGTAAPECVKQLDLRQLAQLDLVS